MPFNLSSLFKKNSRQEDEEIILVSGLPRSGTSMMMRMLEAGGKPVVTDNIRTADESNLKGYYEFERVKKLREGDTQWLKDARGKAVKVVSAHLEYLPADYRYRVIFMRRHMPEILASQRKMLKSRDEPDDQVSDEKLAELFQKHLVQVENWLSLQPNFEVIYVSYNDVLENPEVNIQRINEFLGGKMDTEKMLGVIEKNLYRNRLPAVEKPA
ncbi:MAG: sulfotransferase domain-containing protein [Chloroflexi bacterium]|jgi:hypothetical protein|nr:sulfotransferase domain-containing protein [Chloroflexota bacterium]